MKSNPTYPHTSSQSSSDLVSRAKLLPMPRPGVYVTIPLALLPTYLEMHGMESKEYDPRKGILLIKKAESRENKSFTKGLPLPEM